MNQQSILRVESQYNCNFTAREFEVLCKMCRGTPYKCIAYELNMAEGTVKVHVRNIMKKLGARNRTEVVFLSQRCSNSVGRDLRPNNGSSF